MSHKIQRREFLKKSALVGAALPLTALVARSAFAGAKMAVPGEGAAAGLGYVTDKAKVDALVGKGKGHCGGDKACNFYQADAAAAAKTPEEKVKLRNEATGQCKLIKDLLVSKDATCNVWAKVI